jgi:hypothetical protein
LRADYGTLPRAIAIRKKLKLENKKLGLLLPELGQSLIIGLLTLLDRKKSL